MSEKLFNLAQGFLNEMAGKDAQDSFEMLTNFMEALETKDDPEHVEIYLVDNIQNFLEKYKIMENNIRSYATNVRESKDAGTTLANLYENESHDGRALSKLKE